MADRHRTGHALGADLSRRRLLRGALGFGIAAGGGGLLARSVAAQSSTIRYTNLGDSHMNLWPTFLAQFEQETGIKVEINNFPYLEAHDKFVTLAQGDELPDCAYGLSEWLGEFVERGILVSPEDVMPATFWDNFIEATLPPSTYNDKKWSIPYYYSVRCLYTRSDWFAELGLTAPATWEELLDAASKVHAPPDRIGFGMPANRSKNTVEYFLTCFWPFGGELLSEDGTEIAFNSDAGVEALTFWVELSKYAQPGFLNHSNDEVEAAFREGRIAMTINGPWIGGEIDTKALPVPYEVVLPPKKAATVALAVEDIFMIFDGPNVEQVTQLVDFIFRDEIHIELDKTFNFVPVTKSQAANPYYAENRLMKAFMEAAPYGRFRPGIPQWEQISDLLAVAIQNAVSGQSTPKAALDDAAQQAAGLLL